MRTNTKAKAALEPALFTAADRCDACGARAYAKAIFDVVVLRDAETNEVTGHKVTDLQFCGHHWTNYRTQLLLTALEYHEELHLILAADNG